MFVWFFLTAGALMLASVPPPEGWETILPLTPWESLSAVTGTAILYVLLGLRPANRLLRGLRRLKAEEDETKEQLRRRAIRQTARLLLGYRVLLIPVFGAQLYLFDWTKASETFLSPLPESARWDALVLFVRMIPFFAMLLGSWIPFARVERFLRGEDWTIPRVLKLQLRQYLTPVLPLLSVILFWDLMVQIPGLTGLIERWEKVNPPLFQWGFAAALLLFIYLISPFFLRTIWGSRPLPEGKLRDRLKRAAGEKSFPISRVRLWNTDKGVLNACSVGLLPPFRYIFLSDLLIDRLDDSDLEAVFLHELGHLRKWHFLFYLMFALTGVALILLAERAFKMEEGGFAQVLIQTAVFLGLFWGVLFGILSRKLERQADLYAVGALEDPSRMQSSLRAIAQQSGQPLEQKTFTHGSIGGRIDFLERIGNDPKRHRKLDAAYRTAMIGAFLLLAFFVFVLWCYG